MGPFTEYSRKETFLSRADARLKLLVAMIVLAMIISCKGFALPMLVTFLCLMLCMRMEIPLRAFALRFSEPLFLTMVVILIKLFFTGTDTLFTLNLPGLKIAGHRDGLLEGLAIGARIIGAVSMVALLGFSTPFTELMAGLSWLRVPRGFVEIALFAYRSLFVLFEDAQVIYTAQKNRLGYSSMRRGLNSFGTLAGSLTLKAFENSQNTSVAMVQRGYDGNLPMLKHRPFRRTEIAASVVVLLVMGIVWKI